MNTNRPDLPDELRAMARQIESAAALGHAAPLLHAAVEEFEAVGFTHEEAFSLALQGEHLIIEQSREEHGREERAVGPRLFKSVRQDGTDFCTGKVRWLPAEGVIPKGGWLVEHPHPGQVGDRDTVGYLSASTVETDCTGFSWPARLLSVEPVSDVWTPHPDKFPRKRAAHAWRVVEELPAWQALGPQGREIETLLGQIGSLTEDQTLEMSAAQYAAQYAALDAALYAAWSAACGAASRDAAWVAAWDAVQDAVRGDAWDAAWSAVWDAVRGLLVLDLEPDAAEILLAPWVSVMGRSWEVTA